MTLTEHAKKFTRYAVGIFSGVLIVVGIVWIISNAIQFVVNIIRNLTHSKEEITAVRLERAKEYYKLKGILCPACETYVPKRVTCINCGHIFKELLSYEDRKLIEEVQEQ